MSLNTALLKNVHQQDNKTIAQCPACAETGGDSSGDHLIIYPNDTFACVNNQGSAGAEHRKRIFALVGIIEPKATAMPSKLQPTRQKKIHHDVDTAIKAVLWGLNQEYKKQGQVFNEIKRWPYHKANNEVYAYMSRFEPDGDTARKTFRPIHKVDNGWQTGDPPGKWQLYCLPEILKSTGPIFICEGEKAADAGRSIGLVCTTSSHGADAPNKTDWKPLTGRTIYILPDNDDAGRNYALSVAQLLSKLTPPATIRIIQLQDLPKKGDLYDFFEARDAQEPESIRKEILDLVEKAPEWTPVQIEQAPVIIPDGNDANTIRAHLWKIITAPKLSAVERNRQMAEAVVKWLHKRGQFYHHNELQNFANVLFFDGENKLLLPVQGDAFQSWLADLLAVNRAETTFKFIQAAVETEGLTSRSTPIEPATFWAATVKAFYLSNGPGSIVKISADNVQIVDNGTDGILFPYGSALTPWKLVEPRDPFETCSLFRDMSATAPHGLDLLRLWICSLPSNQRTKPPLVLSGVVGSGKTRVARGIFELYGLPERITAVLKNGDSDFWATMDSGGLACFDNADTKVDWLADALAAAATAGVLEKRRLYTDFERVVLRARSWVCVTSSNASFAADAGLADRLLVIRLERRTGATAETLLSDEIAANRDAGLSFIATTLSKALADKSPVPNNLNARHPDFAQLAIKIGRAIGRGAQAETALRAAEDDKSLFNIENDFVGAVLLDAMRDKTSFNGTSSELLEVLIAIDPSFERHLSAKRLSKKLSKLWPHLEAVFKAKSEKVHGGFINYSFFSPNG